MNKEMERKTNPQRDPQQTITKIGLAVVFLIGAALIIIGLLAQKEFASSGFSSETAYQAIYKLGHDVSAAWKKNLQPELNKFSEADRPSLDQAVKGLAADAWQSQDKGAELPEEADESEGSFKLLYTVYLVNGPKVGAGNRKAQSDHSADSDKQQAEPL